MPADTAGQRKKKKAGDKQGGLACLLLWLVVLGQFAQHVQRLPYQLLLDRFQAGVLLQGLPGHTQRQRV